MPMILTRRRGRWHSNGNGNRLKGRLRAVFYALDILGLSASKRKNGGFMVQKQKS